ncbi:MAG: DUF1638 domain-containing protein [Phycisphaerae bacterium]|jgi:hypothetical protein|nr:DUF1638 domain-containing protein [Phycisphaerae bacterium]MDP7287532.1 DUF1638 domain-containing protein [Phycisphaerae bacterium]
MPIESRKRLKFIGCEIIFREACSLAAASPHHVDLEFLRKGLHDLETGDMQARIQSAIDAVSPDDRYDAILLGYARCNDGVVGLKSGDIPLVIPRAHDCITLFFGSRGAYREYFDENPGTYYMTTGWIERGDYDPSGKSLQQQQAPLGQAGVLEKLGLGDSYEEMVEKYGKDNADYIVASMGNWRDAYSKVLYLKMGVCDEAGFVEIAEQRARENNWEVEVRDGDISLLEKLFLGQWDDDFLVVQPGQRIAARNDDQILAVE